MPKSFVLVLNNDTVTPYTVVHVLMLLLRIKVHVLILGKGVNFATKQEHFLKQKMVLNILN